MHNRLIFPLSIMTYALACFGVTSRFPLLRIYPVRNQIQLRLMLIGVVVLLMNAHLSKAQTDKSLLQSMTELDSSQGYWRLKTQATSRSTQVQFFGADHQLLYEENLPGQWVKLSRKNRKQFDRLLALLVSNQLLTARIKTEILPTTPPELRSSNAVALANTDSTNPLQPASYQVHAYINQSGKLHLLLNNPERLRYKIEVIDQRNRLLYQEFNNLHQYSRRLDLSTLPDNLCQVVVNINKKQFLYIVKRQKSQFSFTVQPQPTVKQENLLSPNQEIGEQQFTPIPISL